MVSTESAAHEAAHLNHLVCVAGFRYFGGDIVEGVIQDNTARFSGKRPNWVFQVFDMTSQTVRGLPCELGRVDDDYPDMRPGCQGSRCVASHHACLPARRFLQATS